MMNQGRVESFDQVVEHVVPGKLDSISRILDLIAERGSAAGLSKKHIFEIQLAVDEAMTNVVEHAYEGVDGELKISFLYRPGYLVVELIDWGKQFDPTRLPTPDITSGIKNRQIGGLGVHFIRKVMDEVTYRYDPAVGNILRMVKHL